MKIIPKSQNGSKINLNNNSILEYKDGKWYKDGKHFTNYGLKKYKFYDAKKKSYMQLNKDGYAEPYTPYLDKLSEQVTRNESKRNTIDSEQSFNPSNKIITLKTKGMMNLADVPINMLDSIARNTGRSRTNIKTNLGLVGKESTFGERSKALGYPWSRLSFIFPYELVNNHAYFTSPENDYMGAINKKIWDNNLSSEAIINAEKNVKYAYKHGLIKPKTKHYHDNILADAFARYADDPKNYNSGQSNYVKMVTNIGNEVWSDPQIQNWWNTSGKQQYNIGLKE